MKKNLTKLLTLLGVFLFLGAGSAHAYSYCYGIGLERNNWTPGFESPYAASIDQWFDNSSKTLTIELGKLDKGEEFIFYKNHGYGDNSSVTYQYRDVSSKISVVPSDVTVSAVSSNNNNMILSSSLQNVKIVFTVNERGSGFSHVSIQGTKVDSYPSQLYLVGNSVNGEETWNTTKCVLSKTSTEGVYQWKGKSLGNGFKVTDEATFKGSINIGNNNGGEITVNATGERAYKYADNGGNFNFANGVTLVENPVVTVDIRDGYKTITVEGYEPLYLFKTGDNEVWNYSNGTKLNLSGTSYTLNNVVFNSNIGYSYWIIATQSGNNWDEIGTKYCPSDGDHMINLYNASGHTSESVPVNTGSNKGAYIIPNGTYNITYNASTNTVAVTLVSRNYPENIYVFGHIKNKYWDKDTWGALHKTSTPGLYEIPQILIQGRWNQHDVDMEHKGVRKKNHSTIDENYVGFFLSNEADISTVHADGKQTQLKFGSTVSDNVEVYQPIMGQADVDPNTGNITSDTREYSTEAPVQEPSQYVRQGESNNYKVGEGLYKIEVNLNEMWVRFYRLSQQEENNLLDAEYVWFKGEDSNNTKAESISDAETHEVEVGDGHKFQVGIENDTEHPLALQVNYVVYKGNKSSVKGKKNVDASDVAGMTVATGVSAEDYDSNPNADYVTHGSASIDDNHFVEFKKGGNYIIAASLSDDAVEVEDYDTDKIPVAYLAVNVAGPSDVTVNVESAVLPFSNLTNNLTFSFSVDNTDMTDGDFTATFLPYDNAAGWETDYLHLATNLNEERLGLVQEGQMIDGAYVAINQNNVTVSGDNGNFTVTVPAVPCSGRYVLTVSSKNTNYTFEPASSDIYIYPTALNQYEVSESYLEDHTATGMYNVNGINWTAVESDYSGEILYPYIDGKIFMENDLDKSNMYTPGVYLANMSIYVVPGAAQNNAKKMAQGMTVAEYNDHELNSSNYKSYSPTEKFNLSALKSSDVVIYVYLEKNGAHTPVNSAGNSEESFLVKATQNGTIPTGVEAIGAEDGEAVYYNLQGVKVENPEKGIYVKVQNGKAVKVIM